MVKTNVRFLALSLLMPALASAVTTPGAREFGHLGYGAFSGAVQEMVDGTVDVGNFATNKKFANELLRSLLVSTGAARVHSKVAGPLVNQMVAGLPAGQTISQKDEAYRAFGQILGSALYLHQYNNSNLTWTRPFSAVDPINLLEGATAIAKYASTQVQGSIAAEAAITTNPTTTTVVTPGTGHGVSVAAAVEVKAKK
jgi:hypothetical protein